MHPRQVLHGALARANALPVCDHYCGVETRIRKSLALQAEMTAKYRACVFDVTLDCEDGAPVGAEREHAEMVAALAQLNPNAVIRAFFANGSRGCLWGNNTFRVGDTSACRPRVNAFWARLSNRQR